MALPQQTFTTQGSGGQASTAGLAEPDVRCQQGGFPSRRKHFLPCPAYRCCLSSSSHDPSLRPPAGREHLCPWPWSCNFFLSQVLTLAWKGSLLLRESQGNTRQCPHLNALHQNSIWSPFFPWGMTNSQVPEIQIWHIFGGHYSLSHIIGAVLKAMQESMCGETYPWYSREYFKDNCTILFLISSCILKYFN